VPSRGRITNREIADLLNWARLLNDRHDGDVKYDEHNVSMMMSRLRRAQYVYLHEWMDQWIAECPNGELSFAQWRQKMKNRGRA